MEEEKEYVAILMEKIILGECEYVFKPVMLMEGKYNEDEDVFVDKLFKPYYNFETANIVMDESDAFFGFSVAIDKIMEEYETDLKEEAMGKFFDEICEYIYIGIIDLEDKLNIRPISYDFLIDMQVDNQDYNNALDENLEDNNASKTSNDGAKTAIVFNELTLKDLVTYKTPEEIKIYLQNLLDIAQYKLNLLASATNEEDNLLIDEQQEKLKQLEQSLEKDFKQIEIDKSLEELNSLIGLDNIKKEVLKLKDFLSFLNKVKDSTNIKVPNLNMVFIGNAGTGKTTVARIITNILYSLEYIKRNTFTEVTTGDFIGEFVGHTGPKTKNLIKDNKGGVIFIDEAYSFTSKGQSFAQEALVEILKEMETGETIFVFAGYKEEMKQFLDMNPGLRSRIGYNLTFEDYSLEELYKIFERKVNLSKLRIDPNIELKIRKIIDHYKNSENFGNARFINNLFDKLLLRHASNVIEEEDFDKLITLSSSDIEDSIYEELDVKTKKLPTIGFKGGVK